MYLKSLSGSSLNQKADGLIPVVFGQEKKVLGKCVIGPMRIVVEKSFECPN